MRCALYNKVINEFLIYKNKKLETTPNVEEASLFEKSEADVMLEYNIFDRKLKDFNWVIITGKELEKEFESRGEDFEVYQEEIEKQSELLRKQILLAKYGLCKSDLEKYIGEIVDDFDVIKTNDEINIFVQPKKGAAYIENKITILKNGDIRPDWK